MNDQLIPALILFLLFLLVAVRLYRLSSREPKLKPAAYRSKWKEGRDEVDGETRERRPMHWENVLGMIVGAFFIIVGIVQVANAGDWTLPNYSTFGGIYEGLKYIASSTGWIIMAIGALIEVVSWRH